LKLEKLGQFFQVLKLIVFKNHPENYFGLLIMMKFILYLPDSFAGAFGV